MSRGAAAVAVLAWALSSCASPAHDEVDDRRDEAYQSPGRPSERVFADPTDALFDPEATPRFDLWIEDTAAAALTAAPREDAPARLRLGEQTMEVTLHLRGEGSFRPLHEKPSFKIKVDGLVKRQALHGERRLVLKNGVQDEAVIAECLAYEIGRALGVPAPRCTQALVYLNDRYLGVYALIEAMDARFLERRFGDGGGNLYEEGGADLFPDEVPSFERKTNESDLDRSDLARLALALDEAEADTFERDLDGVLDLDAYLRFAALELLVGHNDGYSWKKFWRNNFYLYADPGSGRFHFIPSGMDQTFRSGVAPEVVHPFVDEGIIYVAADDAQGLVLRRCLEGPSCRARFAHSLEQAVEAFRALDPAALAARRFAAIEEPARADPRREAPWSLVRRRLVEMDTYLRGRVARVRADLARLQPR